MEETEKLRENDHLSDVLLENDSKASDGELEIQDSTSDMTDPTSTSSEHSCDEEDNERRGSYISPSGIEWREDASSIERATRRHPMPRGPPHLRNIYCATFVS